MSAPTVDDAAADILAIILAQVHVTVRLVECFQVHVFNPESKQSILLTAAGKYTW
jgi:hypothetical protein